MNRRPSHRLAFVSLGLCFFALSAMVSTPLLAEDTQPETTQFSDRADIVVVEVPITVTRKGEPVGDLTADNFEIKFDGKVQEIRSLEKVDLSLSDTDPTLAGRRHFLFLFDLANSAPMAIVRARKAASHVVQTMHPSDLVAVARYEDIEGLDLLLGFTTDRGQVDIALESLGLPDLFHPVNDPLQLSLGRSAVPGGDLARAAGTSLRADVQIRDSMFDMERLESRDRIERMTEAFQSVAHGLAAIEGQVHIVYLTEGWGSRRILGNGPDNAQTQRNIERGRLWEVDSTARFGGSDLLNEFERMIESLRRAGTIVHTVDVGGLRSQESVLYRNNADTLNAMAQDTGGELYDNFNDLTEAMGLILDATSVIYLATIQPEGLPMDGEYRKLKVKLKDGPGWGTKVSHRAGFFAPRPFDQTDDFEKQMTSAQLILGDDEKGTIELAAQAAVESRAGDESNVTLLLELDGKSLAAASDDGQHRQLQLFAYAFDEDRQIHDFFTEVVGLDSSKLASEPSQSFLNYTAHLDLDRGTYRVRVLVRDLESGEYGVRTADVTVEAAGSAQPSKMPGDLLEEQAMAVASTASP